MQAWSLYGRGKCWSSADCWTNPTLHNKFNWDSRTNTNWAKKEIRFLIIFCIKLRSSSVPGPDFEISCVIWSVMEMEILTVPSNHSEDYSEW